jgi:general secretion pathway protein J
MHTNTALALVVRNTAFVGKNNSDFDRVDFTAFAHHRLIRDAKESDQAEIGYFAVPDPDVQGKFDLVRREQAPIDLDPLRGGVVDVVAENIETFDVRYFDPISQLWTETWDSTQQNAQYNRMPSEVRITLTLKAVENSPPYTFTTKVFLPIQQPLTFGIPR